jgi:hypothetical protein
VRPDRNDPAHDEIRTNVLWANIMAGGAGVEYYFGYEHPHSDLTCNNFRVRERMWRLSRIALKLFSAHKVPFWRMQPRASLISGARGWCLTGAGHSLVYLPEGGEAVLDLEAESGVFSVRWYDPRNGGDLQRASVGRVNAGSRVGLGLPPSNVGRDWVILMRATNDETGIFETR